MHVGVLCWDAGVLVFECGGVGVRECWCGVLVSAGVSGV